MPPPPHGLTIDLGEPRRISGFRYLGRQDKIVNGTIAKFRFYVSADGIDWGQPVAVDDFSMMVEPHAEKVVVFATQTVNHPPTMEKRDDRTTPLNQLVSVHVAATDPDGDPVTFSATGLPPGLAIFPKSGLIAGTPIALGSYRATVVASDNKGAKTSIAFNWTIPVGKADIEPLKPGQARFVKLEEETELNGKPYASIAEFNLVDEHGVNLPRTGWTASADSVDASDGAANAFDGNPATIWHRQWDGASPPPPHSLIIDLAHATDVRGFRYLPRQDQVTNGTISKFRFYMSANGVDWGAPCLSRRFCGDGAAKGRKEGDAEMMKQRAHPQFEGQKNAPAGMRLAKLGCGLTDGWRAMKILLYGVNFAPEPTGIGKYSGEMAAWTFQTAVRKQVRPVACLHHVDGVVGLLRDDRRVAAGRHGRRIDEHDVHAIGQRLQRLAERPHLGLMVRA